MTRNKRSRPEHDIMTFSNLSEDEALIINSYRASRMLEQQTNFSRAADQRVNISTGHHSQLTNQHTFDGWNMSQCWNAAHTPTPSSCIPTPTASKIDYNYQNSAGIGPSSLRTTDSTVQNMPDANYYNNTFNNSTNFSFQNPGPGGVPSAPLNMGSMVTLSNDSLSRHNSTPSEDRQTISGSSSFTTESGRPNRKHFADKQREETGNTRKLGACIRCHQQRIRCLIDEENPHGTCLTCASANPKIYRLPCLRYRVGDTIFFREGNAPSLTWSQRWNNMKMIDVVDWESPEVKFVEVSHGFCQDPIRLEVRKFVPEDGDVLDRKWVDRGVRKTKRVEPYGIVSMAKAVHEVKRYISENVYPCLITFLGDRDRLVRETYHIAYMQSMQSNEEESLLLRNVLRLWFAIRHTTASEYLCGAETLGMTPERKDRSYPLFGKIPIAPVMGAQLELILTLEVLQPLRKEVLKQLEKTVAANKPKSWFTIYLTCFIMLHSCSLAIAWHYKYSRRNGCKTRYAMPAYIRELHRGANILLGHFHYCNKGSHPFRYRHDFPPIAELSEGQIQFIVRTSEYFGARKESSRKEKELGQFEEEMYFVSQLFEEEWEKGPDV